MFVVGGNMEEVVWADDNTAVDADLTVIFGVILLVVLVVLYVTKWCKKSGYCFVEAIRFVHVSPVITVAVGRLIGVRTFHFTEKQSGIPILILTEFPCLLIGFYHC
jgi:hypothetical protein